MDTETIIAIYDTPQDAGAAIHDLKTHGVAPAAITLHAKGDAAGEVTPGVKPPPEQHFIPRMFGYEPTPQDERDTLIYERSLESGSSVVVVHGTPPANVNVTAILEKHNPIDIDARGDSYGMGRRGSVAASGGRVRSYRGKGPLR